MQTLVVMLVLVVAYGAIIALLARLARSFGMARGRAIMAGFLVFGLVAGILVAWMWPYDMSVLVNFPAAWLGDWIYVQAIAWIGDPHSDQAHSTIPWILRIPQVYVLASAGLYALFGLLAVCLEQAWPGAHARKQVQADTPAR